MQKRSPEEGEICNQMEAAPARSTGNMMATVESMLGHNAPPSAIEALRAQLAEDSAPLIARRDELLDAAARVPNEIADEEMAGRVGDFVKQVMACMKVAETARTSSKEPYRQGGQAVDGFFKTALLEPLD